MDLLAEKAVFAVSLQRVVVSLDEGVKAGVPVIAAHLRCDGVLLQLAQLAEDQGLRGA